MPFKSFLIPFIKHKQINFLGLVCYVSSNLHFHILNNITYIFIHYFIHTYFKKLQKITKITFQTTLPNTP